MRVLLWWRVSIAGDDYCASLTDKSLIHNLEVSIGVFLGFLEEFRIDLGNFLR